MSEITLNFFSGNLVHPAFLSDASVFDKIPIEKISDFLEMIKLRKVNVESFSDQKWEEIAKQFELKDSSETFRAARFGEILFIYGNTLKEEELREDLDKLAFSKEKTEILINQLKRIWGESETYLIKNRSEALPNISSFRWRVDVRCGSSSYLPRREVLAIVRIGTSDKESDNHVHVELDEKQLTALEIEIKKIKAEIQKAKALLKDTQT